MRAAYLGLPLVLCVALLGSPLVYAASTYPVPLRPINIATGDINNDGNLDLVTANILDVTATNPTGSISIFLGSANGTFGARTDINVPRPQTIVLGDLNGDGRLDIVTGRKGSDSINILLQSGAGTYPSVTSVDVDPLDASANHDPISVVIADVDGDGKNDIVTANYRTNLVPSNVSVLYGDGSGMFLPANIKTFGTNSTPASVAVADINGDGLIDLIVACDFNNGLNILLANSGVTRDFLPPFRIAVGARPKFVSLADFNSDGRLDIAVLRSPNINDNIISVLLANGDGTYQNSIDNPVFPYNGATPDNPGFAVADVTKDGKPDIIFVTNVGTTTPSIFGLTGTGDGTFQAATDFQFSVNGLASFSVIGDFNKDGQLDVATSLINPGNNEVSVELLNPRAAITSFTPDSAIVGGGGFTLTVTGTGFLAGAKVQWQGQKRTTIVVSATQLTATIPASDLQSPGRAAITVLNPAPGGFASNPKDFSVYPATAGVYTVTNTNDSGAGSLRFAMQNVRNGDSILFDPTVFDLTSSDAATLINVLSELPSLDDGNVTIDAQDRRVTVNGSGASSAAGLNITSSINTIRGLSIVGFTKSGIVISGGAKNNTIGGSRASGTGANKQGLLINNNGAFGIEITGAGTDGNVVKGCWIGLEASGTEASGNLAGVIIANGAKSNTIGSSAINEANVISGNTYEGITITGDGTDDNIISGNLIGVAAVSTAGSASTSAGSRAAGSVIVSFVGRAQVGNGSAGVFLSKGTQGSRVGGDSDSESNIIAFNGGSGVEVRALASRKNSSKRNRITRNVRGGIALFDGSNDGIQPPTIDSVEFLDTRASLDSAGRAVVKARVAGRTTGDGFVELFLDDGSQGGTFATRAAVIGGKFSAEIDARDDTNITATFTDGNGNTSPFAVFGTNTDTDGDGISDLLETLAGTDPNNSSDTPTDAGTVSVDKASVKLSFSATGKDAVSATLRLILPENYEPKDTVVAIKFGEISETLTLDAKGASPKSNATLRVKGFAGDTGLLSFNVKNKDLRSALDASGFGNETTAKEGARVTVNVMVAITSGGEHVFYTGKVKLLYKAIENKGGKAAKTR